MRGAAAGLILLLAASAARAGDAEETERYLVRFEDTVRNETPAALRRVTCELLLPQDGPGQRVLWVRLTPHDFELSRGEGGKWSATACVDTLEPGDAVTFAWLAEIELTPRGAAEAPDDLRPYLADDPILVLSDEAVVRAAEEVRAAVPSLDPGKLADAALRHVRRRVRYELDGGWRPAPEVLRSGKGSCSETTFAFVALCRRLGLPARWVGGTLLRGGFSGRAVDSTFHRIAEVHLPGRGFVPFETTSEEHAVRPSRLPSRMLVLSRDASSEATGGLYYHARNSWWAPRHDGKPLPGAARASKIAFWTAAPPPEVDRVSPIIDLPQKHRPSFPRAELLLAHWEKLSAPFEAGSVEPPARLPSSLYSPDHLGFLAAAGHPGALRVAADRVWDDPDRLDDVRWMLRDVLDDELRSEFEPLLGREPAVFAAWWAKNARFVVATEPGRLTLRAPD